MTYNKPNLTKIPRVAKSHVIQCEIRVITSEIYVITREIFVITWEINVITCEIYIITCEIYVITCKIYVITCKIYIITCKFYVITCKIYVTTCEIYVITCEIYVGTCATYVITCDFWTGPMECFQYTSRKSYDLRPFTVTLQLQDRNSPSRKKGRGSTSMVIENSPRGSLEYVSESSHFSQIRVCHLKIQRDRK